MPETICLHVYLKTRLNQVTEYRLFFVCIWHMGSTSSSISMLHTIMKSAIAFCVSDRFFPDPGEHAAAIQASLQTHEPARAQQITAGGGKHRLLELVLALFIARYSFCGRLLLDKVI